MAFFPHVWCLLRHSRIEVDVVISPPLAGSDYRELADQTRDAVAGRYVPSRSRPSFCWPSVAAAAEGLDVVQICTVCCAAHI